MNDGIAINSRHVARFSSGAYCVVAPIPAREAKYFRVKYQNGLPLFTARFRCTRLMFSPRSAILGAGHDVDGTVTG
jgi:hypothetical protein